MGKEEKITPTKIQKSSRQRRDKNQKLAVLTAYDYITAKILDECGIDIILVGDSLGNVVLGYRNTIPVTMTEMTIHTQAVSRAVKKALVVADMPFGSYQSDSKLAVSNAVDLLKAGAEAVKLEGAGYIETVKKIIRAGIPVMGHIGFTPQSVNLTGHKAQGSAKELLLQAKALEKAGCFALVLEMIDPKVAKKITRAVRIPTIGIGSGEHTNGQVLVTQDMLGLYPHPPRFVKKYADLSLAIRSAVKRYIKDIYRL